MRVFDGLGDRPSEPMPVLIEDRRIAGICGESRPERAVVDGGGRVVMLLPHRTSGAEGAALRDLVAASGSQDDLRRPAIGEPIDEEGRKGCEAVDTPARFRDQVGVALPKAGREVGFPPAFHAGGRNARRREPT
ncbi:hypothetical protein JL475_27255 [Streptomyces sp. M2CJ-2]|uniref:hypothetical protein n=1 Tax=Streptomyces sp. M2CJ-2 TaxID=2803948 RepID=UPI0019285BA9|nr:hypothetical protein [Streptomyces sp. M2CJ-2]MBL3669616.1 hypothetical protein [Streptomyces sp. M2CJ-2]